MANAPKKLAAAAETPVVAPVDAARAIEAATAPARELGENVRKVAEKSIADTRAAYERVKSAAEETTAALEQSYKAASRGTLALNTRAVDALRANTEAGFDFVKALFGVKSLAEAITLNSEHARKQFEAFTFQVKDFAELGQKVANETVTPLKDSMGKAFAFKA